MKQTKDEIRELDRFAEQRQCQCGGGLSVAWNGTQYYVRCGRSRDHKDFISIPDPGIERIKRMPGTPEQIEEALEQVQELEAKRRTMSNLPAIQKTKLEQYRTQMELTKADISDILRTLYQAAPDLEVKRAMLLCHQYRLSPLAKHVYLIPFTNRETKEVTYSTVLGIGATRLIARRAALKYKSDYGYVDFSPRIMTPGEQEKINGKVDDSKVWALTILATHGGQQVFGVGAWPKDKAVKGADKGNSPENMAKIRSERQALDRLFPGEMPDIDVIDAEYEELPETILEADRCEEQSQDKAIIPPADDKPSVVHPGASGGTVKPEKSVPAPTERERIEIFANWFETLEWPDGEKLPREQIGNRLGMKLGDWLKSGKTLDQAVDEIERQLVAE